MHTTGDSPANEADRELDLDRVANLLGALALEVAGAQERVTTEVVGQAGAAAAALTAVGASPGRTVEQLRGALGLSQPGAARLFERLAEAGWVHRGGPGGRRGFQLTLTDTGRRKLHELLVARRAVLLDVLSVLDQTELTNLTNVLERLLAARTTGRPALERICRLCERTACHRCPVGHAMDLILEAERPS